MNEAFLAAYEDELAILYERAQEFADEFPGVAERLGGLKRETMDPGIKGLLEGAAFMAARVQLELKAEFSTFTSELLERLLPGHLEPIPSAALVASEPDPQDGANEAAKVIPAGAIMESVHRDAARGVACRFRLGSPITVWPIAIARAEYHASPAPLQALDPGTRPDTLAGLRLSLKRLQPPVQPGSPEKIKPFALPGLDSLVIHIIGYRAEQDLIYEQLFARLNAITLRYLDQNGDPRFRRLPLSAIGQIGFSRDESLFPPDDHVSPGFALLREFFAFPDRFLGFRLTGLAKALNGIEAAEIDLVFEFSEAAPTLAARVSAQSFRLFAAPCVNLFEKACDRIRLTAGRFEHAVVPDRSALLEYEPHRVMKVAAHFSGRADSLPVEPLYAPASAVPAGEEAMTYTTRRLPRRLTDRERRHGSSPSYRGTDLFLTLGDQTTLDEDRSPRELAATALCSNRHLAGELAAVPGGGKMRLLGNSELPVTAIVGPTPPREAIATGKGRRGAAATGDVLWRLLSFLSFNHTGLASGDARAAADALREILSLYSDASDIAAERRLRGILAIECRPVTRRLRRPDGFHGARGIEATITLDDAAFEGAGVMLLGAVLERFLADLSGVNSFVETVVATPGRGIVKRWPPRSGTGPVL
ncbi:type VI secretion system baseplate subunit TssF [Jiella marina]|uniref:type VI secretion system baseplate subunit TssF n=1 Tax=Jiella sp. LLJ827 TaxID=2917712 RepID=UPI002100DAD8|nr:type VI secretion system baseplate subunit TssF [Jiella sp. LLJ827]MCQ0989527.1 type VI secretion system baseplate subunit TssF [Jiella sp. LLJ827]